MSDLWSDHFACSARLEAPLAVFILVYGRAPLFGRPLGSVMRAQIRLVQNVLKHVGFADGRSLLRCFNWIRSHQDLRPRSWRILLWLRNCCRTEREVDVAVFQHRETGC